jgi:formylglycine-generating enzyme required for sulfatase activity
MGDPAFRGRTLNNDMYEERLTTMSPYHLDLKEVTVGLFRASWPELQAAGATEPVTWSGSSAGTSKADWCTWTPTPLPAGSTPNEDLPLNCVTWFTARAYCHLFGKDLPSEAQYEFPASGLGQELGYPWGDTAPTCDQAVYGRSGYDILGQYGYDGTCRASETIGGLATAGNGSLDRLGPGQLQNGDNAIVLDLAGNASEWALDEWSRPDEAFWGPIQVFHDPVADFVGADGDERSVRGGGWLYAALSTRAAYRLQNFPGCPPPADAGAPPCPLIGNAFRCARADK